MANKSTKKSNDKATTATKSKTKSSNQPTQPVPMSLLDLLEDHSTEAMKAHDAQNDIEDDSGVKKAVPIEDRKSYSEDKPKLVKAEMKNLTHILALESVTNDYRNRFFKICMRSMLFLTILNRNDVGRDFTVHEDSDMAQPIIRGGIVTVAGVDSLVEIMSSIGAIYDPDYIPGTTSILAFRLPEPVPERMIKVLRAALEAERSRTNQHFVPKYTYAGLEIKFQEIDNIFNELLRRRSRTQNMNIYAYDLIKDAADYFARIYEDFQCVENGIKTKKAFNTKLGEQISRLKTRLCRIQRADFMSVKQFARFGRLISELGELYRSDFLEQVNNEKKEENDNQSNF